MGLILTKLKNVPLILEYGKVKKRLVHQFAAGPMWVSCGLARNETHERPSGVQPNCRADCNGLL